MKINKPIVKGSIVKFQEGWYRVSHVGAGRCNLRGIFNGIMYHKHISLGAVVEDEAAWFEKWSKSETYQSM